MIVQNNVCRPVFQIDMKAAEKQRLQKRMAELRADRDRLGELLELKDRQLAECRAEATHYEHRVNIILL